MEAYLLWFLEYTDDKRYNAGMKVRYPNQKECPGVQEEEEGN